MFQFQRGLSLHEFDSCILEILQVHDSIKISLLVAPVPFENVMWL